MRILFISANEWEPWGGSEELWAASALVLRQRGADVSVSVKWFGQRVPRVSALASAGCRIHYRRSPLRRPDHHLRLQQVLSVLHLDYLSAADLVVISQGMNWDGLPWMRACMTRGIPYVVIAHAAAESSWIFDDEAGALHAAYEGAARCFFVSHANLELTRKQLGAALKRAEIVRNPFNVPYDVRVPWPNTSSDELRLACVARLDPRAKGQDLLLAVLNLEHWRERAVRVSFIGKGRAEAGLRQLAASYGLQSVCFAGHVSRMTDVWQEHHALVLPSRLEGLPLAGVEAMLAARPVIATDVGGNGEIVIEGRTGFLAQAPSVEDLDNALTRAWHGRGRLQVMGEHAAAHIRDLVPPHPDQVFADRIQQIAAEK